jgi:type VI secretion system protein ImpF
MAEPLTPQERLQPALLDRLTDNEPDVTTEPRERRVISKAQLRQAVLRDLAWLFNATQYERGRDLASAPYVRRSVINFGLPSLSGHVVSSLEITDIERAVRQAILDFEPRILGESLEVKALVELSELDQHNVIGVEIHGRLWAQPVPLELLIRTEIDLETGQARIVDLTPPKAG